MLVGLSGVVTCATADALGLTDGAAQRQCVDDHHEREFLILTGRQLERLSNRKYLASVVREVRCAALCVCVCVFVHGQTSQRDPPHWPQVFSTSPLAARSMVWYNLCASPEQESPATDRVFSFASTLSPLHGGAFPHSCSWCSSPSPEPHLCFSLAVVGGGGGSTLRDRRPGSPVVDVSQAPVVVTNTTCVRTPEHAKRNNNGREEPAKTK